MTVTVPELATTRAAWHMERMCLYPSAVPSLAEHQALATRQAWHIHLFLHPPCSRKPVKMSSVVAPFQIWPIEGRGAVARYSQGVKNFMFQEKFAP